MDHHRHHSTHTKSSIGNTNRRYRNLNYNPTTTNSTNQPSTTYSINFSLSAQQTVNRPYLPGQKTKVNNQPLKGSYNTNLNKYKLLEKELDKRKKEQQQLDQQSTSHHSQSYSNIFSNKSPQFKNRDKNCQLAKPNSIRSNVPNVNNSCETTNSLNDLYKVENFLYNDCLDSNRNVCKKLDDNKSKSIEFIKSSLDQNSIKNTYDNNQKLINIDNLTKSIDKKLSEIEIKLDNNQIDESINDQVDCNLIVELNKQTKAIEIEQNQLKSKSSSPKIILTEPSIDLTEIKDQENYLNQNKLNVYSVDDQSSKHILDKTTKKAFKGDTCWFSWFKVFLDRSFNCEEGINLKDMILILLKRWYRELFLVTILLICIFNAICTSNLATRKTRLPEDFFPSNSLIHDYKYGHIHELSQLAFQNEVTFVMYYAPWNADCIAFRNEYLKISKHYKDQIFFAAVNCFYPDGECSKSYRIKKYPVFIAHIRNVGEVEYKGPIVASYLIPFLDNLLNPVRPIHLMGDLLDLKSKHDGVAVGYFDFNESSNPTGYKHFLLASIKALFKDPFRKVQFAIVSSRKAAYKLYIDQTQSVTLYTWNNTYTYRNKLKKVDNFLKWIYNKLDEDGVLVEWITPIALKSDTLSVKLLSEPTLILFTPRSLILNISPYYDILREVAMDYYNCDNNGDINSLIHRIILRRRVKEEKLFELEEKCHEIAQSNANVEDYKKLHLPEDFSRDDKCCHSQLVNWRPISKSIDKQCYCTACVNINKKKCPSGCKKFNCLATASRYLTNYEPNIFNNTITYCNEIKSTYLPKYMPYYDIKLTCSAIEAQIQDSESEEFSSYRVKSLPDENSENLNAFKQHEQSSYQPYIDESMQRMLKNFEEQHCKRLNLGLNYNDFNFPDSGDSSSSSSSQKWRQNFTGLGCKSNKTLGFIAIDSLMYQSFIESLGINAFNETHATVILIVEAQEENIYVLNHHRQSKKENEIVTINKKMIYEFIKDYESNKLRRYLRSPLERVSSLDTCLNKTDDQGRRIVCVPEVTTKTFNEIVLDDSKDVVLLYSTNWCGVCTTISSTFLQAAKFFSGIDGVLFARINAELNDLPFEYSVDRYPSLILFPARRKSESVTFPTHFPITVTSLLQFVLANVNNEKVKWQSSFQLCNKQCLKRNFLAHHLESKELNNDKIRWINRIGNLKKEFKISNSLKNKNLKKKLNEHLIEYGRMLREKGNKYNLFNNLKEILSKRILNFNEEQSEDLNNQMIRDMVNLLNAPAPQQQSVKKPIKEPLPLKPKKPKSTVTKSKLNKKDEL